MSAVEQVLTAPYDLSGVGSKFGNSLFWQADFYLMSLNPNDTRPGEIEQPTSCLCETSIGTSIRSAVPYS